MKNILILVDSLDSGGAQKQALLLAKSLDKSYSVFFAVYYGERIETTFKSQLSGLKNQPLVLSGNHLKRNFTLFYALRKNKIDILFTYLLLPNLTGGIIGRLAGVKTIVGGIRNSELDKKKISLEKFIHNNINNFTVYNNFRGRDNLVMQGFNKSKTRVVPNVFEVTTTGISRTNNSIINIVSVGRFTAQKDYFTALKAIQLLKNNFPHFHYTIIGWGELHNQVQIWMDEFNINENVSLIIKPDNINEYYKKADIFLMTSIFEGLSNAVMEAMGASLPLVVTDVGDNNKLVLENENGFVVEVGNAAKIAEKLVLLANDYQLRLKMGEKSYRHISDNYSSEIFEKRYVQLIENDFKA